MAMIRKCAAGRSVAGSVRIRAAVGRELAEQRSASGVAQAQLSGSPAEIVEHIRAYESAGASELVVYFGADDLASNLAQMRRFAKEVRTRL
jgi:alkanesulfonate monooxygenase SsuD/methylene tetrahydromethanopterin reductase-like flavin-dependent oxidoreductase (luciferase family)